MQKKILVTGGQGFIGNALLKELIKQNYFLTCLDCDLSNKGRRIPGIRYIHGETKNIKNILGDEYFDIIYHLGEYSRVGTSFKNPEQVIQSNIYGTNQVIDYWKNIKNCKLVYTASSTKFSHFSIGTKVSPYAFTKANNVEVIKKFGEWFNLPYAITYFYNVYGPDENEDGEYATLIGTYKRAAKNGKRLSVVLPGTQRRNFTHIFDIIQGLMLVGEKGFGDGYGIGAGEKYSIIDVANMFGGEIEWLPERDGNRIDAELMTNKTLALGWKQSKNLKEYVEVLAQNNFID